MIEDDLVLEVRAARDAYARSFGYDVHAMVADLRAKEKAGDWKVVRLEPRRPVASIVSHTESAEAQARSLPADVPVQHSESPHRDSIG